MSNPAVITLANLADSVPGFPFRFEIEDNVGEAIHIHVRDFRLDLTIPEFLRLAKKADEMIDLLARVPGFSREQFDPVCLVENIGHLPYVEKIFEDKIPLNDILVDTEDEHGNLVYVRLEQSRVVRALQGDTRENDAHHQVNFYKPHSNQRYTNAERVRYNFNTTRVNGYPCGKERILIRDRTNIIMGGQHRAASMYFLHGNVTVPVLRVCFKTSEKEPESIGGTCSVYYRSAKENYGEERREITSMHKIEAGYEFAVPLGETFLRFDPIEGQYCKVSRLRATYDGEIMEPISTNGMEFRGDYYFFTTDPQIEFQLPDGSGEAIRIQAQITPITEKALDSIVSELEEAAAHMREKIGLLEQGLQEAEAQTDELREELSQRTERLRETEACLAERKASCEALTHSYEALSAASQELRNQLQLSQAELTRMEEISDRQLRQITAYEERSRQLFVKCRKWENTTEELNVRINSLQVELAETRRGYDVVRTSTAYRIGRVITWIPWKIKTFILRRLVVVNYYDDLENRIDSCQTRFPESPRKTALRMIWWNFKALFHRQIRRDAAGISSGGIQLHPLDDNCLNIAFLLGGGFGDNLIAANYIHCFQRKYSCEEMRTDIVFAGGYALAGSLFEPGVNCDRLLPENEISPQRYDLYIWVNRYPRIYITNFEKLERFQPALVPYVEMCSSFYAAHRALFDEAPHHDGDTAEACVRAGKTRIQQPDIDGSLGIEKSFSLPMFIHQNEKSFLESVGLAGKKFITLHRGSDAHYSDRVVKLWPLDHYNTLIRMLHDEFPEYLLVQVGVSQDRCPAMEGVDVSLVGKTTMEDMKVLLKHAVTHIDGEGGFVHLRQALHAGPSVVLFGATNMDFFGYGDNVNIRGDGCDTPCEWKSKTWLDHCVRGYELPPCMASIQPEDVMERLRALLQRH